MGFLGFGGGLLAARSRLPLPSLPYLIGGGAGARGRLVADLGELVTDMWPSIYRWDPNVGV